MTSPSNASSTTASAHSQVSSAVQNLVESTIEVEMQPNFALGIMLSADVPPKINKVLPCSCFLGRLFVGDVIVAINDQPINNVGDFHKASRGSAKLNIRLKRDEYCTVKITKLPSTKPGVDCFDFELIWRSGGMPIGILVYQDSEKRVVISMIESGTLASQTLKPGDVLTKVNDIGIPDKHAAKKLILDSVNAKNKVKLTVERTGDNFSAPSTIGGVKSLTQQPMSKLSPAISPVAPKLPNFDLPLPADVLAILEANKNFHRLPPGPVPNPSILKMVPVAQVVAAPTGAHINLPVDGTPLDEQQIEFDPGQKALRVTPKRVGAA